MSPIAGEPGAAAAPVAGPRRKMAAWAELGPRIASALVLMAAALSTAFLGGLLFDLFWFAASLGILWEWLRLVGGPRKLARFALATIVLACCAVLAGTGTVWVSLAVLLGGATALWLVSDTGTRMLSGLGLFYAGALVLSVAVLRHSVPFGKDAILFLFAVVWGTDCMAYFGGRLIGGPKLSPRFSPSKTWSGFLVGIVSGALLGWSVSPSPARLASMLLLGLVLGAVAQSGDILESIFKRRFNVKDAGSLIPGHGGLMDRLDGFIAASAFAACLGLWRSGIDMAGAGLFQW